MNVVIAVLTVCVALLGVLVVALLRSYADILRALSDLGIRLDPSGEPGLARNGSPARLTGVVADSIAGADPTGAAVTLSLVGDRPTLLAFLTSGCATCQNFWQSFRAGDVDMGADARLVVVTKGVADESPAHVAELAGRHVTVVMSDDAWSDFGVDRAPHFIMIGADGRALGEGSATTWRDVRGLLIRAARDDSPDSGPAVERELRRAGIGPGHPSLRPEPAVPDGNGHG